jgi:hypothetical protein
MVNRILFGLTFVAIGALSYGWHYNNQRIARHYQERIESFINAGPRFTAKDGQKLCERVRELEKLSRGFKESGKLSVDCDYFSSEIKLKTVP